MNAPSQQIVRVDEAFNGNLATSVFNYANVTVEGLVDNTMTTFNAHGPASVFRDYVNSNFPLIPEDLLVQSGAVFTGLVKREFVEDWVASVCL